MCTTTRVDMCVFVFRLGVLILYVLDRDLTAGLCGESLPAARSLLPSLHQYISLHICTTFIVVMSLSHTHTCTRAYAHTRTHRVSCTQTKSTCYMNEGLW